MQVLNTETGSARNIVMTNTPADMPRINDRFTGNKHRFVYGAVMNDEIDPEAEGDFVGVAKFDLRRAGVRPAGCSDTQINPEYQEDAMVASIKFGPKRYGRHVICTLLHVLENTII